MKKRIALFLSFVIALSIPLTGCAKKEEVNENHLVEITESDKYLLKSGVTDYRIVIPEDADVEEKFAASELSYFFEQSTGKTLRTVDDGAVGVSTSQKLLSIGETKLAAAQNLMPDESKYGSDGYIVETRENTVFMAGGGSRGSLFAVYDFIERVIGAKVYAVDEIYFPELDTVKLPNIKINEIPDIAHRAPGLNDIAIDRTLRYRLRTQMYNEGWTYWSHSHFRVIPPDVYLDKHPDWFSPDQKQLCLTNEEMREEFVKNVITLAAENPDDEYIMIGQQDGANMCRCAKCAAVAEKYNYSGLNIQFTNYVAKAVQKWIDENQPGRKLTLGTFAYEDTEKAPVIYSEKDGTYSPIDDTVMPEPNIALLFAPGRACYAHSLDAECNTGVRDTIRGWNAIFKTNLFAWIYNAQFGYYLLPYPNWSSTAENYKILKDCGFNFIYHQGTRETTAGAMSEMRLFVQSKLMWNTSLNMEDLTVEFMNAYYKDAAPYIKEYYDLYRQNFADLEANAGWHAYCMTANAGTFMQESVYPKAMLDRMEELFEEAKAAVEVNKADKELYEKLLKRVQKEQLTVRFLYLSLYTPYFTKAQLSVMIDEFEAVCNSVGITQWAELGAGYENKTIANILSEWRRNLL